MSKKQVWKHGSMKYKSELKAVRNTLLNYFNIKQLYIYLHII